MIVKNYRNLQYHQEMKNILLITFFIGAWIIFLFFDCLGHLYFLLIFISIIIKRGWQCKARRERLTPYQSEDPNPTTPTHRKKEEKGKTVVGD